MNGYRTAVHHVGLKLPKLYALDCGSGEDKGTLQKLCVLDGAVAADEKLDDYGPLLSLCVLGVSDIRLVGE